MILAHKNVNFALDLEGVLQEDGYDINKFTTKKL